MKTIVHIELSNLDRNHLACVWDDKYSSRLVTRNEVTARAQTHLQKELARYVDQTEPDSVPDEPPETTGTEQPDDGGAERISEFVPGSLPDATELKKACECVIEHIDRHRENELYPLNIGWCCSTLVATGVM